ncbi:MAG: FtsW/RodA/SpoVE family cell cycle protein, partial [Dehalococcoidia bacterium]
MAQISPARRNSELSLMLLALIVGAGALALVAVARDPDQAGTAIPFIAGFAACYTVAHFVVRRFARAADPLILPLAAVLNAIGLAAIFRLSPDELAPAQITWTVVGIACFIGTLLLVRDFRVLGRYKYIFGFTGLGLLLLPATPLGTEINGAQLWLRFGGLSLPPGELAKICLVVFFAAYLSERKELLAIASRRVAGLHIPDIKHFGP